MSAPKEKALLLDKASDKAKLSFLITLYKEDIRTFVSNEENDMVFFIIPLLGGDEEYLYKESNKVWLDRCIAENSTSKTLFTSRPWINVTQMMAIFLGYVCQYLRNQETADNHISLSGVRQYYGHIAKYLFKTVHGFVLFFLFCVWERGRFPKGANMTPHPSRNNPQVVVKKFNQKQAVEQNQNVKRVRQRIQKELSSNTTSKVRNFLQLAHTQHHIFFPQTCCTLLNKQS